MRGARSRKRGSTRLTQRSAGSTMCESAEIIFRLTAVDVVTTGLRCLVHYRHQRCNLEQQDYIIAGARLGIRGAAPSPGGRALIPRPPLPNLGEGVPRSGIVPPLPVLGEGARG